MVSALPYEITPAELKAKLDNGDSIALIDVREPAETLVACIDGAELVPMETIPQRLQHLDALAEEKLLVVYCHHGVRSLSVVAWLRRQGVENCQSLAGGIEQWSRQIDPAVPRY